jgi:uncharacterized membrane protein
MALRSDVLLERLRSSLFVVPMAFVIAAIALAAAMVAIDGQLGMSAERLPFFMASTVDSARALLGTVAAATITVAGIAFSIALLVIQMAGNQYSPRVVHGLFRDNFNKRVMGIVVGTFTYCLVVLQSIRAAIDDDAEAVVPNLSVLAGLALGVFAILAVVAFINHNAHALEVSELLQAVTDQTLDAVADCWPLDGDAPPPLPAPSHDADGFVITFDSTGWVQQVEPEALRRIAVPGGTVRFESGVGRYAIRGATLCTVWPMPTNPDDATKRARATVHLGRTRTLGQDPAYGLRQLADVGIRALSTGIDDPTTAQDVIFHLAAVLREMHRRVPPPAVVVDDDNRSLVLAKATDQAETVRLAFDELRRAAGDRPTVCVYLLEALGLLCRSTDPGPPDGALQAMREQASLIVDGARNANLLSSDLEQVECAYKVRFGAAAP